MALTTHPATQDSSSVLAPDLAYKLFDQEARRIIGMSGREFIQRYDTGEFRDIEDTPEGREVSYLVLLIPFGRQDS